MSLLKNSKINDNIYYFDLNNNNQEIKISLANAIRRTIISNIDVYAIDLESIQFIENNSILNNEFLKDRLCLIPILSDHKKIEYENIVIKCNKENNDETIQSIYVSDFECFNSNTQEKIDNSELFPYTKILFCKLRTNQKIYFEAKLKKDNAYNGGSVFCPVSQCTYVFKIDTEEVNKIMKTMNEKEKRHFMTQDIQRYYKKNNFDEPEVYQFAIESIGMLDVKTVFLKGIEYLINHLQYVKSEFDNKNTEKIKFLPNLENESMFQILFDNENETLGNLLSQYLTYDENVMYCGFLIEHPLKKNFILKIKLKKNNNLDTIIVLIKKYIDDISKILNKIIKEK